MDFNLRASTVGRGNIVSDLIASSGRNVYVVKDNGDYSLKC